MFSAGNLLGSFPTRLPVRPLAVSTYPNRCTKMADLGRFIRLQPPRKLLSTSRDLRGWTAGIVVSSNPGCCCKESAVIYNCEPYNLPGNDLPAEPLKFGKCIKKKKRWKKINKKGKVSSLKGLSRIRKHDYFLPETWPRLCAPAISKTNNTNREQI